MRSWYNERNEVDNMQDIAQFENDPDFIASYEVVQDVFKDEYFELSERDLKELTKEIMDTCVSVGGDYDEENVRFFAQEMINKGFYSRFKRIRGDFDY